MVTKRRRFTAEFKKRVALDALRGDHTIQAVAAKHQVHPSQVSTWKRQAVEGLKKVFSNGRSKREKNHEVRVARFRGRFISTVYVGPVCNTPSVGGEQDFLLRNVNGHRNVRVVAIDRALFLP